MTTIKANEISFLLSGGTNNSNPNNSLGGSISNFPVVGSTNNLFSNLTTEEAELGKTDFRCFYVKNTSNTNSLYETNIYIYSQKNTGSLAQLGVAKTTDKQEIKITGSVDSGSILLKYKQTEISASWGGSLSNFCNNIETAFSEAGINSIETSFAISSSNISIIEIQFKGESDYRNHPLLELFSNNLNASSKPILSIRKTAAGQPINSVAPLLATETIPPDKVEFFSTNSSSTINLGVLKPGDFIPVWIKRYTAPGTDFEEKDYFTFKLTGSPFV